MTQEIYDDYRPYTDEEVPAAIERIADNVLFSEIVKYAFPLKCVNEFVAEFKRIRTVTEFQEKVMSLAIDSIVKKTIDNLTYSGLENMSNDHPCMQISNHRDIVLDSAILELILHRNGLNTSEITFGSNLMKPQLVVDIGKLNKMFKIIRGGSPREFLANSLNVSEYMRYAITEKHQSTWIAQRNGRTKDGNDQTEIAVLKMFAMSSKQPFVENLAELNITPIAVSYEREPCDFMKTREIYLTRKSGKYEKQAGEDLLSILHGIKQYKGDMNLTVCKPVTQEELIECDALPHKDKFKHLALIIDKKIYEGYRLFKTNYLAHDLRENKTEYGDLYTKTDSKRFVDYMEQGLSLIEGDKDELRDIFLGIYANPVNSSK
ncbi:MAG: acyltransferase [Dysgonamonadaceae bacterium]|jgi:hypothetical protein|nr:acyltransferase [Dysgonamonadaceae bacterium]